MYVDCPDCYGTGEVPDDTNYDCSPKVCKTCNGSGEVDDEEWDEINAGEKKMEARREPDYPK